MRKAIIITGNDEKLLNYPEHLRIIKAIREANNTPPFWHTTIRLTEENEREFAKDDVLASKPDIIVITLLYESYRGQLAGVLARYGYTSTTITIEND